MDVGAEFAIELGRVSRRWRARLDERLKHTGLTQARWYTLSRLAKEGPLPQHVLAERMAIEGPTLVRILDGLEKQQLVSRCPVKGDRRLRRVELTDKAKPILDDITRISDELRAELLSGFDQEEIATARRVLRCLGDKLERSAT